MFEGKIVVTGGDNNWDGIKSAEAYDYYENKWTYLPNMIEARCQHAAVSMENKMFVIGRRKTLSCEVFDKFSRKFTSIKSFSNLNFQGENGDLMLFVLLIIFLFCIVTGLVKISKFTCLMCINKRGQMLIVLLVNP